MNAVIAVVAAVIISLAVTGILLWVRTPQYRANRQQAQQLLEWMLLGQADENQWRIFCEMPIRHDAELEQIRSRCAKIDEQHFLHSQRAGFLLDKAGMNALNDLLSDLKKLPNETLKDN